MRAPHSYILTCRRGASRLGNLLMDLSNRDIKSTVYHNDSVDFAKRGTQGYPFTFNYDGLYDLHFPISLTDGEFACGYGHLQIWKMIACNDDYAVVFEDDAVIKRQHFMQDIEALIESVPEFDVINLNARNTAIKHDDIWKATSTGVHYKRYGCSDKMHNPLPSNPTSCYLISRQGCNKLLRYEYLLGRIPIDLYMWIFGEHLFLTNEFFAIDPSILGEQTSLIQDWSLTRCTACTQTCNETFGNGKNTFTFYDVPIDMLH